MKTEIFLVITEDRHTDVEVYAFTKQDDAIAYAKRQAQELNSSPEDIEEQIIDGWLYYCQYSCEGDFVRVEKAILHESLEDEDLQA